MSEDFKFDATMDIDSDRRSAVLHLRIPVPVLKRFLRRKDNYIAVHQHEVINLLRPMAKQDSTVLDILTW